MFNKVRSRVNRMMVGGFVRGVNCAVSTLTRLKDSEDGATLMEYAMMVGVILLIVIVVMIALGGKIDQIFNNFMGQL